MAKQLRLSLRAWNRIAHRIDDQGINLSRLSRCIYWSAAAVHSYLLRIQHATRLDAFDKVVPDPPIFVLGFWRSGTTLLHELLCCDQRWGFPSTYACLNPTHFLLTESWVSQGKRQQQAVRPMDNMRFSWESPQEDEFALLVLGAPSPYQALIVPSLLRDPESLLDLQSLPKDEQQCWVNTFCYFLQLLKLQQGKRMVLKSPTHGFRLPLLASLFPGSRYILIERNPYAVFASNIKLWKTLLGMYGVETLSQEEIEQFVLGAYSLHEAAIREAQSTLSPQVFTCVRYEALVGDPIAELAKLYDKMDFRDFETVRPRIETYLSRTQGHVRNPIQLSLAQRERIDRTWGALIQNKGYNWPANEVSVA